MPANPYLTPKADLEQTPTHGPCFYVVSPVKFTVLLIATMGLYRIYWSYKHWALYKASTGRRIWPLLRGVLDIFFLYSLFSKVDHQMIESGRVYCWKPKLRAVALIVLVLLGTMQSYFFGIYVTLFFGCVIPVVNTYLLVGAQRAINFLEKDPKGRSNARFTALNYFWILIGLCFWGVFIWGMAILVMLILYLTNGIN